MFLHEALKQPVTSDPIVTMLLGFIVIGIVSVLVLILAVVLSGRPEIATDKGSES